MSATVDKAIRIANAPCSWGTLEFELKCGESAYMEVLAEMARAGYDGTELGDWGFMPTRPDVLARELEKRNLELTGALVEIALADESRLEEEMERALEVARLLESAGQNPLLVLSDEIGGNETRTRLVGRIEQRHQMREEQWQIFTEGAEELARLVLEKTGIRTVFHPHAATWIETPYEIERFLRMTDPELLGLCLDTGHYALGGGNPVEGLLRHRPRLAYIHLRDLDFYVADLSRKQGWDYFETLKRGIFREPGQGNIDFDALIDQLRQSGYQGWVVVEHEPGTGTGSPLESAWRSRAFLKQFGL